MKTFSELVVMAAVIGSVGGATPALAAGGEGQRASSAATRLGEAGGGAIATFVRDASGHPVTDAVVTAVGRRIMTGVTNRDGRCQFTSLPPGDYLVRVHRPGFVPASTLLVLAGPGAGATWSFVLKAQPAVFLEPADQDQQRSVYAAGFVGDGPTLQPVGSSSSGDGDDHGEVAWRIRHLKRSVLQDADQGLSNGDADEFDRAVADAFGREGRTEAHLAASVASTLPLAGQVNLLTSGSFDSPQQLMSAGTLARGVALVSLGASAGRYGDWSAQGAMTQGDVAAWTVSGAYMTRLPAHHAYNLGMSYSVQRYDGSNPAALAALADGSRSAAVLYAFDSWTISRKVSVVYGGRYANYGYIENSLFSPRARLTVSPTARLRMSVGASRRAIAPGAEEFVPSLVAGTWLPPERTFAPITGTEFVPERTTQFDVSAEHDLTQDTIIGVRRFVQKTEDQLATAFGLGSVERPAADLGHYYVGSAGDVTARGWTVSIQQVVARRLRGSIDYTVATAEWRQTPQGAVVASRLPGLVRAGSERVQDVTASFDTSIPVTETHIFALYRISSGYAGDTLEELAPGPAARFDVQVTQSLPFMDFGNARWEMLVGVRNLFREAADEASLFDELLVTRPPKRIVGGLTLRF
jgi:TonB dependent receptor-like, beta-barrel/Carboxypeptidase regulatory-like domain